jgi:hypothetical protein
MEQDITLEIGGSYGESLRSGEQVVRFVDMGKWGEGW